MRKVELMRCYSKPDGFQKTIDYLRKQGLLTENGEIRPSSARPQPAPPPPFKLSQRLAPEAFTQMATRYEAGESAKALAAEFGISRASLMLRLQAAGVEIRRQRLGVQEIEEATRLYASGLSLAKIGVRFGVDHTTLRRQLLRRGVRMRDKHGRDR
jgi:hypothetical protein